MTDLLSSNGYQDRAALAGKGLPKNSPKGVTEADVLITDALTSRPARQPDLAAENQAFRTLAQQLMGEPQSMLKSLVRMALDLCQADTAGVSLLETAANGESRFRWVAIAGELEVLEQTTTPGNFSPCGTTLHCNQAQLYAYPERYFTYLYHPQFPIVEGLLIPLCVNHQRLGTLWILSHDVGRRFDGEDQRLMTSLAGFTTYALQSILHLRQTAQNALQQEQKTRVALQHSQAQFERLVANVPGMVYRYLPWTDRPHQFSLVSCGSRELLELEPVTILEDADSLVALIHPEDLPSFQTSVGHAAQNFLSWRWEGRIITPSGQLKWIQGNSYAVRTAAGEIVWEGLLTDITEQKGTEAALRHFEEFNRQILDSSDDCIKVLDLSGRVLYMNPGGQSLLGIKDITPFLNRDWSDFWQGADRQAAVNAINAAKAGKVCSFQGNCPTLTGEPRWWDCKVSPIKGADGQIERLLCISRDITEQQIVQRERQRTEAALRQSEHRYRTLFEMMDEGFCVIEVLFDAGGRPEDYCFLETNPAFEKHSGLSEVMGKRMRELFPNHEAQWFETYGKVALTGEPARFINQAKELDGRWFDVYAFRLGGCDSRKVAVLFTDITKQKQAEDALRQSEKRLQKVIAIETVGVIFLTSEGEITYANDAFARMSGYSREDFANGLVQWHQMTPPEGLPQSLQAIQEFKSIGYTTPYEREYICKDGSRRWGLFAASRLNAAEIVEFIIDISDSKRAEEALRLSEERMRLATSAARIYSWEFDVNSHKARYSANAKEVLGFAQPEDIAENIGLIHEDDRHRILEKFQQAIAAETKFDEEFRLVNPSSGEIVWHSSQGVFIGSPGSKNRRFVGISQNITERKQAEAEREQLLAREQASREQAEAANRIKDEFLAVLSHELRSPLNPILGWSSLLQTRKLDEAKIAQALATIQRNARLQSDLIEDLLDVSRILRGKLSLNVGPVDLATMIQSAIETVRLAAEAKAIQVQALLAPKVGQVAGDSTRLQQVIWNLLSNAVKFTPEGGQVNIQLKPVGSHAQIIVSDTGQGIHPDFLPHVFDYFRQADAATTRNFGGLGLGLAIVHHLVELHGGTVVAESPGVGQGATFTIQLPLMPTQPTANQDSQLLAMSLDLSDIKILVVDDDTDTRELTAFLLEQYGARVTAVSSAQEALVALTRSKPHVLLSDIGMPNVDGYVLIQQVRTLPSEQGGQIPAIALTAYAGEINQQQALAAGFQKHISKPIEPRALVQAISSLVPSV